MLDHLPAEQQAAVRLSAAVVRLIASLRAGDLLSAADAADIAEPLLSRVLAWKLARYPEIRRHVLCGRAAVELWSGHLEEAARILEAGLSAEAAEAASDRDSERVGWAGQLALVEALCGRLSRAAELASQAAPADGAHRAPGQHPDAAPLVALAWVHVARNELPAARTFLKQADAALGESPDKLIGAVAYLVAAGGALAEGRATVAAQIVTRARSGWLVPAWLGQQLGLVESRAWAAAGDVRAALAAAGRAGDSAAAVVTLAHARAVTGDGDGDGAMRYSRRRSRPAISCRTRCGWTRS